MPEFSHRALDALSREAAILELPMPHERKGIERDQAALVVDRLLVRVARGSGALELAIGEELAALAVGDRVLRLGFSAIGDYARERLGIGPGAARRLAWRARALAERPLLREAVRAGEVSPCKAEAILGVARGEAEAEWVERARHETVRALTALAREARRLGTPSPGLAPGAGSGAAAPADDEDEAWERLGFRLPPGGAAVVREALDVAGQLVGAGAPLHARLEAICAEVLETWPIEPTDDGQARETIRRGMAAAAREALEIETCRWQALEELSPVSPLAAPPGDGEGAAADPWRADDALRALCRMRTRWDEVMGHLALLLRHLGLWRELGFESLGHYAAERLGMAGRTLEQRACLERRLYELPELRSAMREGRLSYEQARLVGRVADASSVDGWIERAEATTCIALHREIASVELAGAEHPGGAPDRPQMSERQEVVLVVPTRVGDLLRDAFRAIRAASDRLLPDPECLVLAAEHFLDTWKPLLAPRRTPEARARARDRDLCQVPGCSRSAAHAHHVRFRSRGGGDQEDNLVSLCAPHHLHGVHRGFIRVRGTAPNGLLWELGVGRGHALASPASLAQACTAGSNRAPSDRNHAPRP